MTSYDTFVIGASAGGVEALIQLVSRLPASLPAAILVVVHIPPNAHSLLPQILSRKGSLPAAHAEDGEPIRAGRIYVAPPDRHLLINGGAIHLSTGPRENSARPAIDPLFRSAARSRGSRVVGLVLSGNLGDGSLGLQAIKSAGGLALVQDPEEALFPGMPLSAIQQVSVDAILPLDGLARKITALADSRAEEGEPAMALNSEDPEKFVRADIESFEGGENKNGRSMLTCPECGGVIWELHQGDMVTFRCHVGHAYSVESFLFEQGSRLEAALWTAVRALEERAALLERLSSTAATRNSPNLEERLHQQAVEVERSADLIRTLLLDQGLPNPSLSFRPSEDEPGRPGPPPS